jgi:hypothetical protein
MFTSKMQRLPVTDEAKVFYLSNCLMHGDYIEAQQDNGVDPPKIRLDFEYAKEYFRINDLDHEDMISIIEELSEIGLIDESDVM